MATAAIVTEFNGRNGTDELRTGNPLAVHSAASAEAATPAETPVETPVEEPIAEVPIAALPALMPPPPLVRPGTQMSLF